MRFPCFTKETTTDVPRTVTFTVSKDVSTSLFITPPPPTASRDTTNLHTSHHVFPPNTVTTSKYTWYNFLPISVSEQFRRLGNVYFLAMGIIMGLGFYTNLFVSAISPWTTIGPLTLVVAVSLAAEGRADLGRHR